MKTGLETIRIKWKKANYVSKLNIICAFYVLQREKGMRKKVKNTYKSCYFILIRTRAKPSN